MKKSLVLFGLAVSLISSPAIAKPLVYIAAGSANKIVVVDAATDQVVNEYDGIENPHSIVSTPDGEYVISGSLKENQLAGDSVGHSTIYLVHPAHGHVMLTMSADGMIHHQTITPDGRYVISTHPTQNNISVVDLNENKVVRTVKTGNGPNYAVVSNNGKNVFVSNSGDGTIIEIETSTWTATRTLEAGPGPEHMVLSKDGRTIFVINPRAGLVSAVSIENGAVSRTYDFGGKLHGLDISDDGSTLFITNKQDEKLILLDPISDTRRISPLSPAPYHLETIQGTGKVYVSSSSSPKIWVIDQVSGETLNEIEIVGEGHQMTIVN